MRQNPPALKRLGQNFLTDPSILERIALSAGPAKHDTIIEIGAGRGSLTQHLAAHAGRVIAIEIDRMLAELLRERFATHGNVEIVERDALTIELAQLAGAGSYKVAGNIPYNITTPLLFHATRQPAPETLVFLVQKEVADRAAASPGSDEYGALSVNLQATMKVEILFTVPPGAFTPRPSVESALLRLRPLEKPVVVPEREEEYRNFVIAAFGMRRKQLQRILRSTHQLSSELATSVITDVGLLPTARPETLSAGDFAALLSRLSEVG